MFSINYSTQYIKKDSGSVKKNLFWQISKIAAVFILGLIIASGIYFVYKADSGKNIQQVEFLSQTGFRNQFKLPDGTTGWLGYNSELKFHINGENKRIVDLDGLAFFEVVHQKEQPFIVRTPSKLDVEVLGTRFNVSSYSEENFCEVVLEQGSVRLGIQNHKPEEMVPGERVIYNSDNNRIERSYVNVRDYVAWKDGKLILNDLSLEESCLKLGRFYNVDFELQTGTLNKQKVRLILENETLEDALSLLTMIAPVRYQVVGRKILDNNSYSKEKNNY